MKCDPQRKARKRCIAIAIALSLAVLMLAVQVAMSTSKSKSSTLHTYNKASKKKTKKVDIACSETAYPDVCMEELSQYDSASPRELVSIATQKCLQRSKVAKQLAKNLSMEAETGKDKDKGFHVETMALYDCLEMATFWERNLNLSVFQLNKLSLKDLKPQLYKFRLLISISLSYQTSCHDGFDDVKWEKQKSKAISKRTERMQKMLKTLSKLCIVAMGLVRDRDLLEDGNLSPETAPLGSPEMAPIGSPPQGSLEMAPLGSPPQPLVGSPRVMAPIGSPPLGSPWMAPVVFPPQPPVDSPPLGSPPLGSPGMAPIGSLPQGSPEMAPLGSPETAIIGSPPQGSLEMAPLGSPPQPLVGSPRVMAPIGSPPLGSPWIAPVVSPPQPPVDSPPLGSPKMAPLGSPPLGSPGMAPIGSLPEGSPEMAPLGSPETAVIGSPPQGSPEMAHVGSPEKAPVASPLLSTPPIGSPNMSPLGSSPLGSPEMAPIGSPPLGSPSLETTPLGSPQMAPIGSPTLGPPQMAPEMMVPTGSPEIGAPIGAPKMMVPIGSPEIGAPPEMMVPIGSPEIGAPEMMVPIGSPEMAPIVGDVVVSLNGDGDYSSIEMAVNNIPLTSLSASNRWVIYIKEGVYQEYISLSAQHKYVTFIGDGIGKTIITGNRNVALLNYTTFRTATVAVVGQSFMAKGITFQNTAGPEGHQAVALRAGADFLIFDSCSFEGYQDTLYAHSGRHFYYNCDIYGTVDYIFGNAVAVFQKCRLYARKPMKGQSNVYTAQGRLAVEEPTGFSFQNCTISAASDLSTSPYNVYTYLGRPWKAYSRVAFLHSVLDSVLHPQGWLAWNTSNPYIDTLYYGEYNNYGPGSNTSLRVDWPGVHSNMAYNEASLFSVENFLASADSSWLTSSGIDFIKSIANV